MKKMLYVIVSVILVLGVIGICYAAVYVGEKNVLPEAGVIQTEEDAIAIGMTIIKRVYPQFDYDNLEWSALYCSESGEWGVFCYEEDVFGGYPQINIKKMTGEVVFISLMA